MVIGRLAGQRVAGHLEGDAAQHCDTVATARLADAAKLIAGAGQFQRREFLGPALQFLKEDQVRLVPGEEALQVRHAPPDRVHVEGGEAHGQGTLESAVPRSIPVPPCRARGCALFSPGKS